MKGRLDGTGFILWLGLIGLFFGAWLPQSQAATEVLVAQKQAVYFKNNENRRQVDLSAQLPQHNPHLVKVTLDFSLQCPEGRCDAWDRFGTFGIVEASGRYLELFRFMTPYGIGSHWTADLSDFLPLLEGNQTFRIFIDTWVGPGHPQGNGWLVTANLRFEEGDEEQRAIFVQPLLSLEEIVYGDPLKATRRERSLDVLPRSGSARLHTLITGHGQGNAENCAEFCPKYHSLSLAGQSFQQKIWRDNCATSVDSQQHGNYRPSRAGWCPGAQVEPWIVDLGRESKQSQSSQEAMSFAFQYDVEAFVNSCRPDAPRCEACVFGTSCQYDGGFHTEARYFVSSYLIYRP